MSPIFAEKIRRAQTHLVALGVSRSSAAPPFYRIMWRLGIAAPPPLFTGFLALVAVQGVTFGLLWGLGMLVLVRFTGLPVPGPYVAIASAATGLAFGVVMAVLIRRKARGLSLPPWSEYTPP